MGELRREIQKRLRVDRVGTIGPRHARASPRSLITQNRILDGKLLTGPEVQIYYTLKNLNVAFRTQVIIGFGNRTGGGKIDFWLPLHRLVIEYQGPWHAGAAGQALDFQRAVTRAKFGATDIIHVYERDLDDLENVLRRAIGISGA